ncbi:MAG: RHS repeat-associated core domain-containing protein [Armatimonadetes bacterium]|nr:RHS repeat-associated core domain-containing protein [Armatimonadota bacterium]
MVITQHNDGTSATFNAADQMTAFGATTFGYGADGLRTWKKVGEADKRYFLYEGGQAVCMLDSSGNVLALNTFGPTGLISRSEGTNQALGLRGNHYFFTFDPRGNVAQIQNNNGTIAASMTFDAYGAPIQGSTSNPTPFGYGGQSGYYKDRESGLILCSYRYYDPAEGRWLTRDPIGYDGGINVYAYCGGNPVGRLDPSGFYSINDLKWT